VTDLLANLKDHWRQQGISHGPPVSRAQILEFEARYGVSLPADLRAYLTALNGSELGRNGPMDDQLISFWHLSEIRPLSEEHPESAIPHGRSYFVFADYSIDVHAYVIRLSPDPRAPAPVMVALDELLIEVAPSFSAFIERYRAGDSAVLFPDLPAEWFVRHGPRRAGS
jgi:hypothetical protein